MNSYYRNRYGFHETDFPVAARIGRRTLSLPLYPKLHDQEVEYVIKTAIEAHERS
jgi:UDP-4-amino-4-deoxy-L-arabinose-oxoglutarate aminotransferase